jgi:hypothetical protein
MVDENISTKTELTLEHQGVAAELKSYASLLWRNIRVVKKKTAQSRAAFPMLYIKTY